jgi:hypothetical protein
MIRLITVMRTVIVREPDGRQVEKREDRYFWGWEGNTNPVFDGWRYRKMPCGVFLTSPTRR